MLGRKAWLQASLAVQFERAVSKRDIESDERMEKVTAAIVARGAEYNAADVYQAFAKKAALSAKARVEMSKVDLASHFIANSRS